MNRVFEYVSSLSAAKKDELINHLISNAPDEVPGMKNVRECLDSDHEDALNRSKMLFLTKKQHPKIPISKLCYDFGVGESSYKKYKSIHGKEWENHYNTRGKFNLLEMAIDAAQDGDLSFWKMYYNSTPIDLFLIPESFKNETSPPPNSPQSISYVPEFQKISTNKIEREMIYI